MKKLATYDTIKKIVKYMKGNFIRTSDPIFRQPSTTYAVGDIVYVKGAGAKYYLLCVTAGTTGGGDIALPSPIAEKDTVTDGTVTWTIRKIDITQYANELAGKADRSLSNLTEAGKSFSFPSDTYVDILSVFGTNGATYVAPADGYLYVRCATNNSYGSVHISLISFATINTQYTNGSAVFTWVPIRKGQTATLLLTNATARVSIFTYAQGEVPN